MTTNRHEGLLIPVDPDEPIRRITIPTNDALDALQALVGGNIEAVRWPPDPLVTTYVNEEGKFECERNQRATELAHGVEAIYADDFIAGPWLILGFNPETGDHTDLNPTLLAMLCPERFVLEVTMGNEAMSSHIDVSHALESAAVAIRREGPADGVGRDTNGNAVVTWSFR